MATGAENIETAQPASADVRTIVTPEGVPVQIRLAERGERAAALCIDLIIALAAIIASGLLIALLINQIFPFGAAIALFLLISFLIRSFYFIYFELRWEGTTPGKRILGLRVIDRSGGRLKRDAVFARNLMREVEVFMPISLFFSDTGEGSAAWVNLLVTIWLAVLVLLPFFNRDRLRAGDIIAGTWIISMPKTGLLADVTEAPTTDTVAPGTEAETLPAATHRFSLSQLDAYGIYELQTLETALRNDGPRAAELHAEISGRIAAKIGWPDDIPPETAKIFLTDYYAALRSHLENKAIFGERRKDKHDTQTGSNGNAPS